MEKEFIFEGKKYISAKRASELYGYNSDYIGQLCRGGLIDGRMLGRSWFVLEDALIAHKEAAPKKPRGRLPRNFIALKDAANLTGYTTDHISYLCRNSLVECRMVHEKWFVAQESIVSYKAEAEQRQKERADALKQEAVLAQQQAQLEPRVVAVPQARRTFALNNLSFSQKVSAVAIALVIVCASALMIPRVREFGAVAINGTRASVAEVFLAVESSLRGAYHNLSLVSEKLGGGQGQSSAGLFADGARPGIAVVPSSHDPAKDEIVKQYIKDSFSDETRVLPDNSGVSGVIKPVFKKQSDQDYLYVMVPVKN